MAYKRHGKGPAIPPGDPPNPGISLNPANNDGGVIVKVLEEPWSLPELRKTHQKLAAKVDSLAEMVTNLSSQLQGFLSQQAESENQSREDHISDFDDEDQHQTSQSNDVPETQPTPITDIDAKLKTLNLTHSEEEDRKNRKMEAFGGFLVDEKAVRVENIFLDFLKTFRLGGELYYDADIEAMINNESTTMFIDFSHVMTFNNLLQKAISDEFLRFEPYLRNACKRFVMERRANAMQDDVNKDINVAFFNLPASKKLRELTMAEIGKVFAPFEGTNTSPHHSLIIGDENIIDSCVEKLVNTKDEVPDDSLVVFCESLRYAHLLFDENPERDKVTFEEELETVAEAAAKQRTAMHSVLWNWAVDHFRMNDYVTSADMFEKAMLYIPFDIENRILRAKGFRMLCLCHLGLSHLDQAQEYINEAEKLEPNIASAFLKHKIYLQKKDHDGVIAQIRAMTDCSVSGDKVRSDYDARHRVALRLLATWLGVEWLKVEVMETMVACSFMASLKKSDAENTENIDGEEKVIDDASWENLKRGSLIGAAALTGGTLMAIRRGIAAPAIAQGLSALAPVLGGIVPAIGAAGFAAAATATGSVTGSIAVAASFGAAGAGLTGVKMARRTGNIEEFEFKAVEGTYNQGRLGVGIVVSGMVFEDEDYVMTWDGYNDHLERYALFWESKNLVAFSTAIQDWLNSKIAVELMKEGAMLTVLNSLVAALAMPATLVTASDLIDSKWAIAVDK